MKVLAVSGGIVLVILILLVGRCGFALYGMKGEVPKVAAATAKFVELYDTNDFAGAYGMCDSAYIARIPREEHDRTMGKVRDVAGNLVLGAQLGWNGMVYNGERYLTLTYACASAKGDVVLTVKFHDEGMWKLESYNVNLK